jgi:hypothetical protein
MYTKSKTNNNNDIYVKDHFWPEHAALLGQGKWLKLVIWDPAIKLLTLWANISPTNHD